MTQQLAVTKHVFGKVLKSFWQTILKDKVAYIHFLSQDLTDTLQEQKNGEGEEIIKKTNITLLIVYFSF